MTEESKSFGNWEEVIVNFLNQKKEAEEEVYLKNEIKKIAELYKNKAYFNNQDIKNFFDPKKEKKDNTQSATDFQRKKFQKIFTFNEKPNELDVHKIKKKYQDKCEKIADKFEVHEWITAAAQNANSVSFATHVIKLTHSKIDSTSFYDQIESQEFDYVTTASLNKKIIDGAVCGNQFAPIYQFLELELNGNKLAPLFTDLKNEALKPFSKNKDELEIWNKGFNKSLYTDSISSHSLAKQIFFPINDEQRQYHLLCPVKSSSLAHAIFEYIFDEQQKMLKKIREKDKYSNFNMIFFSKKANISVTASNASNASQLNGKRGGKLHLFSCLPPIWQSQLKPPINSESFFYSIYLQQETRATIDYLRDFLLRFQRIDLSIRDPDRRKWVANWVGDIIEDILAYADTIHSLQPGWSSIEDIRLKPAHQYFLDPLRNDEAFQTARKASDWQSVICSDFAHWLNSRLIGKEKQFTPQREHRRLWIALMQQSLREYSQALELEVKTQAGEEL